MVERIIKFFEPYMADYGYWIVFAATMLENSVGAGLIVPGETLVLIAAFYAAIGHLDPVWVAVIAFAGSVVGDNLGYVIGRSAGRGFLERHGRWLRLTPERLDKADAYYARHGGKTVFLGRFVPVVRSVVCVLAGVGHMRYWRFASFDAAGSALWAVGHTALGYAAGRSYEEIERYVGPFGLLVLLVLGGMIGLSVWWRRRRTRAQEAAAAEGGSVEEPEASGAPGTPGTPAP